MSMQMSEEELYREAKKRVEEKKDFFTHLAVYLVVNVMLILIWAFVTDDGFPWFVFPLGGWGIGVLFHFLNTFVFSRGTDWEKRAIEREMERLRKVGK
jgi:cytochrome b561